MDPDKLAKVLAMAESEHQGEALSALRAARIMLSRAGLSFRDLAERARTPVPHAPEPPPAAQPSEPAHAPAPPPPPDELVRGLRRQVKDLELELATLRRQLDKAAGDADRQREEADRWRTLARETAEKLWDMGKALERKHSRHADTDKRRAVLELLQDPGSALLSDREIARRVGVSAHDVAHWRRRMAIVGRKLRLLPVVQRGRGLWGGPSATGLGVARLGKPHAKPQSKPHAGERHRWLGFAGEVTIAERGSRRGVAAVGR
ncbi:hypothetical protein TSH100_28390 [Azospirillum sp. TSH100]|uniref:hypothetical protein n=1 Tax=Azospirillum sp. TSH100 TaxID=652764 RepID=UPI000D60E318|nr:hypothetical protein [Azospirillum sp. TSH100]PWC80977.1 hypothetical protein TSH100_28390 [Azospirillum sp. TSH100]QCG87231.1 hypothetical protein E6C72_05495 [Azospirillum sp. TSH100]